MVWGGISGDHGSVSVFRQSMRKVVEQGAKSAIACNRLDHSYVCVVSGLDEADGSMGDLCPIGDLVCGAAAEGSSRSDEEASLRGAHVQPMDGGSCHCADGVLQVGERRDADSGDGKKGAIDVYRGIARYVLVETMGVLNWAANGPGAETNGVPMSGEGPSEGVGGQSCATGIEVDVA